MKSHLILIFVFACALVFPFAAVANDSDDLNNFKSCKICGMDRNKFGFSRVMIEYEDGTKTGTCSIQCAVEDMSLNTGKQTGNILVADYNSRRLIEARTASWVIGGKIKGIMTPVAKWAFADKASADAFVKKNGGKPADFPEVLAAAKGEMKSSSNPQEHSGHSCDMVAGAQMLYNPAFGDQIYHVHPAGMWMFNYKFMHTQMNGLRAGTSDVNVNSVGPTKQYPYMMIPTSMSMDMHMLMAMYGLTDRLTAMVMGSYQVNHMDMLMDMGMGMGAFPTDPMNTDGIGDIELRAVYAINTCLAGSLGLSLPTGSIDKRIEMMGMDFRAPYDMQLGSGTVDLKPALTYTQLSGDALWNWGAQLQYTAHLGNNSNDYRLGDNFKAMTWVQRAVGPATGWVRLVYNYTDGIHGRDPEIQKILDPMMGAPTPDADPSNYGGHRLDGLLGVSFTHGPFSMGVEGGIPFYQDLNGLQLRTDWILTFGGQMML